jgi:hypothetical protein
MSLLIITDKNFKEDHIKFDDYKGVFYGFNLGVGTTPTQETRVKIRKEDVDRLIALLEWYKLNGDDQ